MVESPTPVTCQSDGGSPGSWFSHATGLAHAASARDGAAASHPRIAKQAAAAATVRVLHRRAGHIARSWGRYIPSIPGAPMPSNVSELAELAHESGSLAVALRMRTRNERDSRHRAGRAKL